MKLASSIKFSLISVVLPFLGWSVLALLDNRGKRDLEYLIEFITFMYPSALLSMVFLFAGFISMFFLLSREWGKVISWIVGIIISALVFFIVLFAGITEKILCSGWDCVAVYFFFVSSAIVGSLISLFAVYRYSSE